MIHEKNGSSAMIIYSIIMILLLWLVSGIFFLINLAHICLSKQFVLIVHIVIEDHDEEYHNRMVNIDLLDPVVCHHVCTNVCTKKNQNNIYIIS